MSRQIRSCFLVFLLLLPAAFCALLLSGCGRDAPAPGGEGAAAEAPSHAVTNVAAVENRTYEMLAGADRLVEADGEVLTKDMLERAAALRAYLYRRGMKKKNDRRLDAYLDKFRARYPGQWVAQTLVSRAAGRGSLSEEGRNALRARYVKLFAHGRGSYEDLRKDCLEKTGQDLDGQLAEDLRVESFFSRFAGECAVTDAEVEDGARRTERYNAISAATNRLIYARATNVWMRAKGGGDFARLADAFSEEKEKGPGGACGVVTAGDYPASDADIWKAVSALPPGGVSGVLGGEDHLEIVKSLGPGKTEFDEEGIRIARIWFRLPMFYPEMTKAQIRASFEKEKRDAVRKRETERLVKQAKIVYPNGRSALPKEKKRNFL